MINRKVFDHFSIYHSTIESLVGLPLLDQSLRRNKDLDRGRIPDEIPFRADVEGQHVIPRRSEEGHLEIRTDLDAAAGRKKDIRPGIDVELLLRDTPAHGEPAVELLALRRGVVEGYGQVEDAAGLDPGLVAKQ